MKSSSTNNRNNSRQVRRINGPRGPRQTDRRQLIAQPNLSTRLVYGKTGNFSSSTADVTHVVIRGNSLYDPEHAIGGGQPLGFDQLSALYNHYKVTASRMEVTMINRHDSQNLTNSGRVLGVILYPSVFPGAPTNFAHGLEQPFARHMVVGMPMAGQAIKSLTTGRKTTSGVYGCNTNDQDFKAATSANPAKEWFWHIYIRSLTGEPLDISYTVKVYYDAKFSSRVILNPS